MGTLSMTRRGDVIYVPASQQAAFEQEGWTPIETNQADTPKLSGKALDEALRLAGLPTSGKADEKRERLAAALIPTAVVEPIETDTNEAEEATR